MRDPNAPLLAAGVELEEAVCEKENGREDPATTAVSGPSPE